MTGPTGIRFEFARTSTSIAATRSGPTNSESDDSNELVGRDDSSVTREHREVMPERGRLVHDAK